MPKFHHLIGSHVNQTIHFLRQLCAVLIDAQIHQLIEFTHHIFRIRLIEQLTYLLLFFSFLFSLLFWLDVIYILPLTEIYWKKKLTASTLSHVVSTSCRRCLTSCRRQLKVLKVLKVFVTSNGSRAEGESLVHP